ncbi:hypothetical protein K435DRAFT_694013 [Dendrothele bispora CBS 962.96]|uniref:F-box domain-containing protein n=1 Tax=Dendrothele bispora (strain CBS 962.96) TaxID=1314807 RepID=A0A4S8KYV7_DENBC|nr:hypothetical protein K435DRAFT_694013 [Dendrothele bispora CBS 962.96]
MTLQLPELPPDVIILIINYLCPRDLSALSGTCTILYSLVDNYGWTKYLRLNPRPSVSLSQARGKWSPTQNARYNILTDQAWSELHFVARPLSRPWIGRFQPVLALNNSRLVVASGCTIYSYRFAFVKSRRLDAPPVQHEGTISLSDDSRNIRCDITSLAFIEDGRRSQTLLCGLQNGTYVKVLISLDKANKMTSRVIPFANHPVTLDTIQSLSADGSLLLSLTYGGEASLMSMTSPDSILSSIHLTKRSWKSFLNMEASSPFAAFGTSSNTPLTIHSVLSGSELSQQPTTILSTREDAPSFRSAVYGICRASTFFPGGSSPQILVSGWFDGQVRVHDLRVSPGELGGPATSSEPSLSLSSSSQSTSEQDSSASTDRVPLRPVLTLSDPWTYDPIYSVSSGGGNGSHIAAGSARHSVVSFWDVRNPSKGWSVYAPGNDRSPVYDVVLESSRLFGATESRPFVYDFGPGVTKDTYPFIKPDNLRKNKSNPISYYVTKYTHTDGIAKDRH